MSLNVSIDCSRSEGAHQGDVLLLEQELRDFLARLTARGWNVNGSVHGSYVEGALSKSFYANAMGWP